MADQTAKELKDAEREYASILSQLSNEYAEVKKETSIYQQDLGFLRETTSRIAVAQQALANGQTEYKNANGKTVSVQKSLNSLLLEKTRKEAEMVAHLRRSIVTAGNVARVDKQQMELAQQEMAARNAKIKQAKEAEVAERQRLADEREALLDSRLSNRGLITAQQGLVAGLKQYEAFQGTLDSNTVRTDFLNDEFKSMASKLKKDYPEVEAGMKEMKESMSSLAEIDRRILVARRALEKGDVEYVNAAGEKVNVEKSLTSLLNTKIATEENYHDIMKSYMADLSRLQEAERNAAEAAAAAAEAARRKAAEDKQAEVNARKVRAVLNKAALALIDFVDAIYKVQQDVGIQMGSATSIYANALISRAKSLVGLTGGPILGVQEIVDATANFKKEFGIILDSEEAERIAGEAKRLGVSSTDYVKAKRAFLGTGAAEDVVRQKAISEFQKQGLAGADAIQFAAQNADLLAIAGGKYAQSLFRAAAESRKIGVNLRDIEKFANSIVGDFEGSLENFAELSALGVEMDFNQLAQAAATGTPEEIQNLLQEQLSLSGITGEELQRNRQVRLALTQTTGLDEATILRLAGVAQAPTEKTVEEKQVDLLSIIAERMAGLVKVVLGISTLMGVSNLAGKFGLPGGATGGFATLAGRAALGAGVVGGVATGTSVGTAMGASTGTSLLGSGIGTALGAVIGSFIAPGIGTAIGAQLGGMAGGALAGYVGGGKAAGGLITGPGTPTSDNILTPSSPGEFVVNAKATSMYGADFLNNINAGAYRPQQPVVNNNVTVNTDTLKDELRQVVQSIRNMRIEMNGYEVGHVAANESRTPLRTR